MLSKKVTKSKIGSKGCNVTNKLFHSTKISNQSSFFFTSNFLDNITARNSKTECYKELHLSRCSGGLSTGAANNFMRGGRESDIMDVLY